MDNYTLPSLSEQCSPCSGSAGAAPSATGTTLESSAQRFDVIVTSLAVCADLM